MNCAIYARVSTTDQTCALQLSELREYVERRGWKISREYVDTGWSGTKASRPELDRLLADASEHRFDSVLVWKIDRFGRSVLNLSQHLNILTSCGVRFIATTQSIDTDQNNPTSRLMLNILSSVAEFEREMIRERTTAGMSEYRKAYVAGSIGKHRHSRSGKDLPHGRPRKVFRRDQAVEMRERGVSWREIARELGVPQSTIRLALGGVQKTSPGVQ